MADQADRPVPATGTRTGAPAIGVSIRGARFSFRQHPLFEDLTADFEAGRTTCLLGPSGAGKSSLLRLIAGLARADAGTVTGSDGRPLAGRIAYMDQRDLLLPWKSVLGNVMLGSRLRGEGPDLARASQLLAAVGLERKAPSLPAVLSGGQRQRAALARTLMEDRPVVLMDEPFSALDAITRHRIQALAAGLLEGRTVVLVTHDPFEALRLGHRVHVMASQPAHLGTALDLPGDPPRDPTDSRLNRLHHRLLEELAAADDEAPAAANAATSGAEVRPSP